MKKRIIALVLCVFMLVPLFSSCSGETVESVMQIYLSHQVYDLDPLNAMTNDAQLKIVSLIFAGLYKLDDNGRVQDDLVARTDVVNSEEKGEYIIRLTLKDTCWSDGSAVSSDDVVYTFKRVLKAQNSNSAAAMLMNIKNAKEVKAGTVSIDDLGVTAPETNVVEISFNEPVTNEMLDEFKLSLTSPSLFPLRENYVQGKPDWAKKASSLVCSGPFLVRRVSYEEGKGELILERNEYYFRNREKDAEDKYVTPLRLVINYGITAEEQLALYESGQVVFVNEIPLSKREEYSSKVKLIDTLSTHTYYFNQNASVYNEGYKEAVLEYFASYDAPTNSVKAQYNSAFAAWTTWKEAYPEEVTLEYPSFPAAPKQVIGFYTDEGLSAFKVAVAEYNQKVEEFKAEYALMNLGNQLPPTISAVPEPTQEIKLFANDNIRKALSLAIDRDAIAAAIVYAKPATGLLNDKVFYGINSGKTFRSQGGVLSAKDIAQAQSLIAASGIKVSDFSFSIRVRAADEVHIKIAELVAAAWTELGFNVDIEPVDVIVNDDVDPSTNELMTDIRDDIFDEEVVAAGNYQVMAFDLVAQSPSALSILAPYAFDYTGNATVSGAVKAQPAHQTGYNSEAYNELIEKAFNAESADERAQALLEAEKLLTDTDAVVVPVLFNQSAYLIYEDLDIRSLSQSYYGYFYFTKANLKNWQEYRDLYFADDEEEDSDDQSSDDVEGGADPQ